MGKSTKIFGLFLLSILILFAVTIPALRMSGVLTTKAQYPPPGTIVIPISGEPAPTQENLQLHTFPFITATPTPVPPPPPASNPNSPGTPFGPPVPPGTHVKVYCVDDNPGLQIEVCDDASKCDQPHGAGGPNGTCGTVIGWEHAIIDAVGQGGGGSASWNSLTANVASNCYTAVATPSYPSTFNVIDAYNLAGFHETSRTNHVAGQALHGFWQSAGAGYRYSPGTSMQGVGPGYAIFFASGHVAMVNHVQVDARGNGKMSFLHSGGGFYLGLGFVVNGALAETSSGEPILGFGGHTTAVPFSQEGIEACTPGS